MEREGEKVDILEINVKACVDAGRFYAKKWGGNRLPNCEDTFLRLKRGFFKN